MILESGRRYRRITDAVWSGKQGLYPDQVIAQFDNMKAAEPKNHYTVGINDDVTHHVSAGRTGGKHCSGRNHQLQILGTWF